METHVLPYICPSVMKCQWLNRLLGFYEIWYVSSLQEDVDGTWGFRENRPGDSHILLKGVNGFLPVHSVFLDRFGWNSALKTPTRCRWATVTSDILKSVLYLGAYMKRHFSSRTSWPLKIGPIRCPETSVENHSTLRNIPEQCRSNQHRGGSLRSRKVY